MLSTAAGRQAVSLEAEDVDPCDHTGWSVLVTGVAQLVSDPSVAEWTRARLQPSAPGPHRFLIKVPSTRISGQRLAWGSLQSTA
jgi:hypothetical protein